MGLLNRLAERLRSVAGRRRLILAMLLGALSALSLPPVDAWPLLFASIPAFFLLADRLEASWRSAFALGWCFGFGYFLAALHWIGFAFLVDAADYLWMMPFAVLGLVAFLSLYWGAALVALHVSRCRGLSGFLMLVAALAFAEHWRGVLLTGFPWAAPGIAADGMGPVAQLAAVCGMEGLTLLILLWAGVWPFTLKGNKRHRVVAGVLLATMPLSAGAGWSRLNASQEGAPVIRVRLVQPNIPQNDKWRGDNMAEIFNTLMALSARPAAQGAAPQIIIWPESAVPYLLDEAAESRSRIGELLGPDRLLISGSLRRIADPGGDYMKDRVFNSVLVINGEGEVIQTYDKWKLVPGGEFLPFEPLLGRLGFRKVVTLPGSFEAGSGAVATMLPGFPAVGLSVCYEAIFPGVLVDIRKPPGWLVNVTNDGWFGQSTGPYQHFAQARLRSIEQGLPMARAANTGISGAFDSKGRLLAESQLGSAAAVDFSLPLAKAQLVFAQFGYTISFLFGLFIMGIALALRRD